jgi:hypothetical protein
MRLRRLAITLAVAAIAAATCRRAERPSSAELVLARRTQGVRTLIADAERGKLLDFRELLVVVDQHLVQDLITSMSPFEREVGALYKVRIDSATAEFEDGLALVRLDGRAALRGSDTYVDLSVFGGVDVLDLDADSGLLRARMTVFAVEVPEFRLAGQDAPAKALAETISRERVEAFADILPSVPIPVRLQHDVTLPAVKTDVVKISETQVPIAATVLQVLAFRGKLWVTVGRSEEPEPST